MVLHPLSPGQDPPALRALHRGGCAVVLQVVAKSGVGCERSLATLEYVRVGNGEGVGDM